MTSSWTSPDPRPVASGTAFGRPGPARAPASPRLGQDVRAGLLTVVVTVLLGAPVGLLWAALAPQVTVAVTAAGVDVVDADGDAFFAADGYFVGAVVLAGAIGGLLAWRLAAAHGPAVVLGLAVGGLAAAGIAVEVGELVGVPLRELVEAGFVGQRELAVRLRSPSAVVGWPLASLLAYVGAMLAAEPHRQAVRRDARPVPISSG